MSTTLEAVACCLCCSDDYDVIYHATRTDPHSAPQTGEFRASGDEPLEDQMVRCRLCGLQYVSPRLDSKLVLAGYADSVDEVFVSQAAGREITFKSSLSWIQQFWQRSPATVLDIGAANGSFLKVARDAGWDVLGSEPNRWMCEWSAEHHGITLRPGTVFDGHYDPESIDLVTLWDVLEHTPDPIATLKECARILRPRGMLVLSYPDIGSWIARAMGKKWVFLLSVHYFYFTRRTISASLRAAGFEPIRFRPHFQTLAVDYILFRATPYLGRVALLMRRVLRALGLGDRQLPYWVGQTTVIARRRSA